MKFKKGDKVVMVNCGEATFPENYGKIWTCYSDSWITGISKNKVVFLQGYSGYFYCKYLQLVKITTT